MKTHYTARFIYRANLRWVLQSHQSMTLMFMDKILALSPLSNSSNWSALMSVWVAVWGSSIIVSIAIPELPSKLVLLKLKKRLSLPELSWVSNATTATVLIGIAHVLNTRSMITALIGLLSCSASAGENPCHPHAILYLPRTAMYLTGSKRIINYGV